MQDLLSQLNPRQKEAVETTEGPVLVLAGAGSGKTRALTFRIAYLIAVKNIKPEDILAVTFTNKAAQEMQMRVSKLLQGLALRSSERQARSVAGGTFHSVCAKILRREIEVLGYERSYTIYDSSDTLSAVRKCMQELSISTKAYNPRAFREMISSAKSELMNPKDYETHAQGHIQELVARVYYRYAKYLKQSNALDFDDLLMKTVELWEKFPKILDKYRNQWRYVLVDEYQDTNRAQYVLVNLLAKQHKNLCVVGDDWQSIYSWRGADISNILDFEKDYPNAKTVMLEQNYRSTKNILETAQQIISQNTDKKDKKLWTENESGEPVQVYTAHDERDEARFIIEKIQGSGERLSEFVILYRTNAQSRILEEMLMRASLPYNIIGSLKFYERKEIKDMLAYLRLVNSFSDRVSFERVINEPPRGVGKVTLAKIEALAFGKTLAEAVKAVKPEFFDLIAKAKEYFGDHSVAELIDYVALNSGYRKRLLDGTEEGEERWQNVQELKSVAQKYKSLKGSEALEKFLEEVALVQDTDQLKSGDQVTLMTLHSAKGLEYPTVFMAGMEEGLFPHARSYVDQAQLEEERRLCYVGMTRAQKELWLTHATSRKIFGNTQFNQPSQFLNLTDAERTESNFSEDDFSADISNKKPPENSGGGGILDKILGQSGEVSYDEVDDD